jgi:hypothetical protein
MFRSAEIATALAEVWIRNGTPNKTPTEVAAFYCALYDALEESQSRKIPKYRSIDAVIQLTCGGVVALLTTIWIFLAVFVK